MYSEGYLQYFNDYNFVNECFGITSCSLNSSHSLRQISARTHIHGCNKWNPSHNHWTAHSQNIWPNKKSSETNETLKNAKQQADSRRFTEIRANRVSLGFSRYIIYKGCQEILHWAQFPHPQYLMWAMRLTIHWCESELTMFSTKCTSLSPQLIFPL